MNSNGTQCNLRMHKILTNQPHPQPLTQGEGRHKTPELKNAQNTTTPEQEIDLNQYQSNLTTKQGLGQSIATAHNAQSNT